MTTENKSRITLLLFAHGEEIIHDKICSFDFHNLDILMNTNDKTNLYNTNGLYKNDKIHNPNTDITLLNCGSGECGLFTYTNDYTLLQMYNTIKNTISLSDSTNTFETMKKTQQKTKPIYKKFILSRDFKDKDNDELNVKKAVVQDKHCKIYHPIYDRSYLLSDPKRIIFNVISGIEIIEVFDSPHTDLIRHQLYEQYIFDKLDIPSILDKIDIAIQNIPEDADYSVYEKFYNYYDVLSNLLSINQRFKESNKRSKDYKQLFLSEIYAICKLLGFKYINIYEISCRGPDKETADSTLRKINKTESNISQRSRLNLGGMRTKRKHKHKYSKTNRKTTLKRKS